MRNQLTVRKVRSPRLIFGEVLSAVKFNVASSFFPVKRFILVYRGRIKIIVLNQSSVESFSTAVLLFSIACQPGK